MDDLTSARYSSRLFNASRRRDSLTRKASCNSPILASMPRLFASLFSTSSHFARSALASHSSFSDAVSKALLNRFSARALSAAAVDFAFANSTRSSFSTAIAAVDSLNRLFNARIGVDSRAREPFVTSRSGAAVDVVALSLAFSARNAAHFASIAAYFPSPVVFRVFSTISSSSAILRSSTRA